MVLLDFWIILIQEPSHSWFDILQELVWVIWIHYLVIEFDTHEAIDQSILLFVDANLSGGNSSSKISIIQHVGRILFSSFSEHAFGLREMSKLILKLSSDKGEEVADPAVNLVVGGSGLPGDHIVCNVPECFVDFALNGLDELVDDRKENVKPLVATKSVKVSDLFPK